MAALAARRPATGGADTDTGTCLSMHQPWARCEARLCPAEAMVEIKRSWWPRSPQALSVNAEGGFLAAAGRGAGRSKRLLLVFLQNSVLMNSCRCCVCSLLVYGIKRIEGRGWPTEHRDRLWIAATAREPSPQEIEVGRRVAGPLIFLWGRGNWAGRPRLQDPTTTAHHSCLRVLPSLPGSCGRQWARRSPGRQPWSTHRHAI